MNKQSRIQELERRIQELERIAEEKEREIRDREATIEKLSIDPAYGVLYRPAIDLSIRLVEASTRYVVFLDIDYLHDLNSRIGHEEANSRIRRALSLRSSDVLLKGRLYSGDELVILLSGNPEAFCNRLSEAFRLEGMSITCSSVEYTGALLADIARAKSIVDQSKAARGIKR